jgi:2Fe-2S ferredoxin
LGLATYSDLLYISSNSPPPPPCAARRAAGEEHVPKVTYVQYDGKVITAEVPEGRSLMQGAVDNQVDGVVAICGGSCSCGTCQVYVDEAWLAAAGEAGPDEVELLAFSSHPAPNLRLACQIPMSAALDGIQVSVPKSQH